MAAQYQRLLASCILCVVVAMLTTRYFGANVVISLLTGGTIAVFVSWLWGKTIGRGK